MAQVKTNKYTLQIRSLRVVLLKLEYVNPNVFFLAVQMAELLRKLALYLQGKEF
jgi:hypothetical protein